MKFRQAASVTSRKAGIDCVGLNGPPDAGTTGATGPLLLPGQPATTTSADNRSMIGSRRTRRSFIAKSTRLRCARPAYMVYKATRVRGPCLNTCADSSMKGTLSRLYRSHLGQIDQA